MKKRMNNDLTKVMEIPDKGVGDVTNVLAKLFRQIMWDEDITPTALHRLIVMWESNPNKPVAGNQKTRSRKRSAKIRALARDRITWRVFTLGLDLFCIDKYTFKIGMRDYDDVVKIATITHNESLATLFSRVRREWDCNDAKLDRLLKDWWKREDQQALIERYNGRKPTGNIKRGLKSENITWTFFMQGLMVLKLKDVTFQITLKWWDGIITTHEVHEVLGEAMQQ